MSEKFVDSEEEIEERIIDLVHQRGFTNVGEVVAEIQRFDKSITREEIHDVIRKLEQNNLLGLSESAGKSSTQPVPADSKTKTPAGLLFCVAVSALALVAVYLFPQVEPWSLARLIIANLFLFVIPGYSLSQLLFSRDRLRSTERIGISVVLSLAIVALIGMILVYAPIGVRLESVITSVASFSIAVAAVSTSGKSLHVGRRTKADGTRYNGASSGKEGLNT